MVNNIKSKYFFIALSIIFALSLIVNSPLSAETTEVKAGAPAVTAETPAAASVSETASAPAATSEITTPAPSPAAAPVAGEIKPASGEKTVEASPASETNTAPAANAPAPSSDEAIKTLIEQIKSGSAITEEKLNNGIKIIYRKNTSADMVVLKLITKAGSTYETEKNNGITCLLFDMIKKGNVKMKAEVIARNIEQTGAIFKTDVTKTLGTLTLVSTRNTFEKNFDIITDCILTSNFPQTEVEKEKQFLIGALKAENDKMDAACSKLLYKTMFAGHPYALHHYGSVESVSKITRAELVKLHKTIFVPENMTFVVIGNIDYDYAKQAIEKRFGGMKPVPQALKYFESADKKIAEGVKLFTAPREAKEYKDKSQAFIYYGFLTEGVESADYGALKMLVTVLGSGMSSRLFHNLRDKESLAYQVSAYYQTLRGNSAVIALMGTQPQKYEQAVTGLKREIEAFKNELITEEEYDRARNKLVGTYALQRNTMEDQAEFLGLWEGLGLGAKFEDEYLQNVLAPGREDVQRVARKYFDSNKFVLSVIHPEAKDKKDGAETKKR